MGVRIGCFRLGTATNLDLVRHGQEELGVGWSGGIATSLNRWQQKRCRSSFCGNIIARTLMGCLLLLTSWIWLRGNKSSSCCCINMVSGLFHQYVLFVFSLYFGGVKDQQTWHCWVSDRLRTFLVKSISLSVWSINTGVKGVG